MKRDRVLPTGLTLILAALAVGIPGRIQAQGQSAVEAGVQRYNGPTDSDDLASKVTVDAAGNVIVAGYSSTGVSGYDWLIIKYSGAGAPLWTNRYDGPVHGDDQATALAVDGSGNVFVTGYATGILGTADYATIAYSAGGAPLWTNFYNGPGNDMDFAAAVAVDGSGHVIVTGYATGSDYYQHLCATIAYSSAGAPLWTNLYAAAADLDAEAKAMAVDASGNVFVAGFAYDSLGYRDFTTLAYSSAGAPLWTNLYNATGSGSGVANALAVDGSGHVLVTGGSAGSGSLLVYTTIAYSGAGAPLWTNRYHGPGNDSDSGQSIAVDSAGNVFVMGSSPGADGFLAYATVAYSGAGAPLWTNRYHGPGQGYDYGQAVAVDGSGKVFVTGVSLASAGGPYDSTTIAYSVAGAPLWTNHYSPSSAGFGYSQASAMSVDGSGNVFVTGSSLDNNGFYDVATIAYSGAGNALWTNLYNGPRNSDDQASAVVVDAGGNVIVAGSSVGSGNTYHYATIKYPSAGPPLWTNRYNGPGYSDDHVAALAVDGSGNVLVTGYSSSSGGSSDYVTLKYSSAGGPLWTNRYHGPANGTDQATAVAVAANGNVFVTGYSAGAGTYHDYATIAYSSAGAPLWTNRYNGPANGDDVARAVAVDASGNVFVGGSSVGSGSSVDYTTIKYSSAGAPLWTNRYNGPASDSDSLEAMALDSSGNVFVTGWSYNSSGNADYATIKYSNVGAPLWTNRYGGPGSGFDGATALAVDAGGNVFVTGYSAGAGSSYDYATIAYSSAGAPLWTNRYNGPANSDDEATAVAVNASGNVFVTGYSLGAGTAYDYVTVAYSSAGALLWTKRYNGPANGNDQPPTKQCLALGSDGSVYVTGASQADYATYTSGSPVYDFATIKYAVSPAVLAPPTNQTVFASSNATFSVSATGSMPLSYQWLFNGTNISGATDSLFTVSNVVIADRGSYSIVLTNIAGSVTSAPAMLTVLDPPVISAQPASRTNAAGTTATFSVSASALGGSAVAYQWRKGGIAIPNGGNTSGTTSATLSLSSVAVADAGSYSVAVTNSFGAVTSAVAVLTVATTPGTDPFTIPKNTMLTFSPTQLLTNDVAGSANGGNTNLTLVSVSSTSAQGGSVQITNDLTTGLHGVWTNRYDGPANSYDGARAVAVDSNGNVFVTGYSESLVGGRDFITFKYSNSGTALWTNRYDGPANSSDDAFAVALDSSGNVFVTGYSYGPTGHPDYATIKYSNSGAPLWTNRYDGGSDDFATGVAVDNNGTVYVTGYSYGGGSGNDYLTVAYSNSGAPLWTNRYTGTGNGYDQPLGIAVDNFGKVFVTGTSAGSGGLSDCATVAYSSAGARLWTNRYDGPAHKNDAAVGLAPDGSGNVYVAGYETPIGSGNPADTLTIKYSGAGVPQWTNRLHLGFPSQATAMTTDANGNAIVTGFAGSAERFTVKYSGTGAGIWTNITGFGPKGNAVAVDRLGNVLVAGVLAVPDGSGHVNNQGALIKYSATGQELSTSLYDPGFIQSGDPDEFDALAVDNSGNVFVAGAGGYDFATLKYSPDSQFIYNPPTGFVGTDTFTYVIQDSLGMMATGTVCVAVFPPPVILVSDGHFGFANGQFGFNVFSAVAGTVTFQASTNLKQWLPLQTNAIGADPVYFTDPQSPSLPRRFYRAVFRP
jgi:uncharacterized delta-60 repeat protein